MPVKRHEGQRPDCIPAYASIRQHTSAYVSARQHTSSYVSEAARAASEQVPPLDDATASPDSLWRYGQELLRPRSAYVSIREHTLAYVSIRELRRYSKEPLGLDMHTSAYVSIREHT